MREGTSTCRKCGSDKVPGKHCPACRRIKLREWYAKNPARQKAATDRWLQKRPRYWTEYSKRWITSNQEKYRNKYAKKNSERAALGFYREYYKINPKAFKSALKKWREKNPDKVRAKDHRRRARLASAEGYFSPEDIALLLLGQDGLCKICGVQSKLTIDHIVPLSRGGSNWPDNLQLLCGPCNSRKGARLEEDSQEATERTGSAA